MKGDFNGGNDDEKKKMKKQGQAGIALNYIHRITIILAFCLYNDFFLAQCETEKEKLFSFHTRNKKPVEYFVSTIYFIIIHHTN